MPKTRSSGSTIGAIAAAQKAPQLPAASCFTRVRNPGGLPRPRVRRNHPQTPPGGPAGRPPRPRVTRQRPTRRWRGTVPPPHLPHLRHGARNAGLSLPYLVRIPFTAPSCFILSITVFIALTSSVLSLRVLNTVR